MAIILYVGIFILGLIIGSFLNCVIFRIEEEENFLKGRSKCPHCKHELSWKDLIPIISFLSLGGKCRYCSQKISWQYPSVELVTGLLFVLIFYQFAFLNFLNIVYFLVITSLLIIIFVYDLKYYLIPDGVVYSGIGLAFLYNVFKIWDSGISNWQPILNIIFAISFGAGIFLLIFLIS